MQETWVWKGDAMELALKESNKLKKGRKKKEDRTESKNRMFALKGLMNYKEKQPWFFFQIERAEKTKKKKTKSKSRILSAKTTLLENHPFVNPWAFITEIHIKFRVQTSAENCRLGSVLSGPSS